MAIEWDFQTMTTGSAELDSEHKEWIRRFNDFDAAVVDRHGIQTIQSTLDFFSQYSKNHFPHEEALMDFYQCPAAGLNRSEHEKLRQKLSQIETWVQSDGASLVEVFQLKIDMEQWLVNHIGKIDTQLRDVMLAPNAAPAAHEQPARFADLLSEDLNAAFSGHFVDAILQSSPDVILIVNDEGKIVFVSGRCVDLLGFEPQELIGHSAEILVPSYYRRHVEERERYRDHPVSRAMSNRPVMSAMHKSGAKIPVDISLSPLPAVEGMGRLVQAVIRDAMPRWNTQHNLLVQSVAMNAAANGIVITDTHGVIQWVNPAVTRMTGYPSAELIGKNPRILKSGQHEPAFYEKLWQTVMAGNTWFGEIINRRKDGSLYCEEQHIAPVRSEDGQITRLIAIKQDVTARKQAETKLQEANRELQRHLDEIQRLATLLSEANKALEAKVDERTAELAASNVALAKANHQLQELDNLKSAFLGVISHELRTPFVGITFSMQLIEGYGLRNLQPEQAELFEQLDSNINSAKDMIENLVNYATFVRQQGELRPSFIDITTLLNHAVLPFRFQSERKGIRLSVDVQNGLPQLRGDEARLIDAVTQLIGNAIKYTGAGGMVTVRAWQAQSMVHIAVQDTGIGVPADKLATLWESFAQMADPLRRGREGLGLGLALVEYIVRAHKGHVWAESEVGVGSTFGFRLPLAGVTGYLPPQG